MMKVEIKKVKLSQIKLNPDNPRKIAGPDMDRLVKSLTDFPEMMELREIVVDETMTILGGNMRYQALKKIKAKDCLAKIVKGLTDAQKREFVIKDNSNFGVYDWDVLKSDWDALPLAEWGVELPDDWAKEPDAPADAEPQIDRAAELNKTWGVKSGDLWQVGEHRLLCGDSMKKEDVEWVMGGEKADMVFTDPPYGVAVNTGSKTDLKARNRRTDGATIKNDAMKPEQFRAFILTVFKEIYPVIKDGGVLYICHAEALGMDVIFRSTFAEAGFKPAEIIVWVKDVFAFGRQDYHWRHEPIIYGWKEGAAHFFIDDHTQDTVWNIPRPKRSEEHPTMKPVELPQRAIANSSRAGEFIYDPFLGSGTTMVACQNLNRKCRGIEISEAYCAVILQRMTDAFPDIEIKKIER